MLFGELLLGYLQQLQITLADFVLFVADGAPWIWNTISTLIQMLGLKKEQVYELIDFYHLVTNLGNIASQRQDWTSKERKRWITIQRRQLLKGKIDSVIKAVRKISDDKKGKKSQKYQEL